MNHYFLNLPGPLALLFVIRVSNLDIPGPGIGPDWQRISLKVSKSNKIIREENRSFGNGTF